MLFISHSTVDKTAALDLQSRLQAQGYNCEQQFLDSDQRSGIKLGESWERVLYDNLRECQGLLVLCSPSWAESKWCFAELAVAKMRNIGVFPIVLADCDLTPVSEFQVLRLDAEAPEGGDQAFARLFKDLEGRGLGPRDLLPWPNPTLLDSQGAVDPCPFPGLPAFDERYAAVYFGREREKREVLTKLGVMRSHGEPRLLMIVGGSGSGKSSLLLAGVLPRLRHPTFGKDWLVLPTLRPQSRASEGAPLATLAESLLELRPSAAAPINECRKMLVAGLSNDDHAAAARFFLAEARDLCLARGVPRATVLLPIDQFEELLAFATDGFLAFLAQLCSERDDRLLVVATMRSDSLDVYERHPHALQPPSFASWRLTPFPCEQIANVILRPAQRAGVEVTPDLLDRLRQDTVRSDARTTDALPLLAFTLERLFRAYAGDKKLELAEYEVSGGMEGGITYTAERILRDASPSPDVEAAVRASFVIQLARINDRDEFERRPARWEDIDPRARPILAEFVAQRLLVKSTRNGETTIEVAHEAMFRCWSKLSGWLRVSADISRWRRDLTRDRDGAQASGRVWKGLTGPQFAVATKWPRTRRLELQEQEVLWIQAAAWRALCWRVAYVAFACLLAGFAIWAWNSALRARAAEREARREAAERKIAENNAKAEAQERKVAEEQAKSAEQRAVASARRARAGEYAAKSRALLDSDPRAAMLVAVEALHATPSAPEPVAKEALSRAMAEARGIPLRGYGSFRDDWESLTSLAVATSGKRLAVGYRNGSVHVWRLDGGGAPHRERILPPQSMRYTSPGGVVRDPITNLALSADGRWAVVVTRTASLQALRIVDLEDGAARPAGFCERVIANHRRDALAVFRSGNAGVEILDLGEAIVRPPSVSVAAHSNKQMVAMAFSSDDRLLVALDDTGRVVVHDVRKRASRPVVKLPVFKMLPSAWDDRERFFEAFPPDDVRLSPDGRYLVVLAKLPSRRVQPQRMAEVWDLSLAQPAVVARFPRTREEFGSFDAGDGNLVTEVTFSPDAKHMLLGHDRELRIWDLTEATPADSATRVLKLSGEFSTTAVSPDGRRLAIGDSMGRVSLLTLSDLKGSTPLALTSNDATGWIRELVFGGRSEPLFAATEDGVTWVLEPRPSPTGVIHKSPPELVSGQVVKVDRSSRFAAALCRTGLWLADLVSGTTKLLELPQDVVTAEKPFVRLTPRGGFALVSTGSSRRLLLVALKPGLGGAQLRSIEYGNPSGPNLTIDATERWLALHGDEATCLLVPLVSTGLPRELPGATGRVLFSPDGSWLVTGLKGRRAATSKPVAWRLHADGPIRYTLSGAPLDNLENWAFDPQGVRLVASEGYDRASRVSRVFVWPLDGATGPGAAVVVSGHTMPTRARFSPDGRWLITFGDLPGALDTARSDYLPKRVRLWRLPQLGRAAWEDAYRVQSLDVGFSPDGRWLTLGSDGSLQAKLIDLSQDPVGSATTVIESGANTVGDWRFTFSPDGRWFTTQGFNADVRLWRFNAQDRAELIEDNIARSAAHVAFSPDQRTLAVCDETTTRVFWLTQTSPLRRLSLTGGGSPNYTSTSRLYVNAGSGLRVHDLDASRSPLLASRVGRNLTWEEWNREFPGRPYAKTLVQLPAHVSVVAALLEKARSAALSQRPERARRAYTAAARWAIDAGHPGAANSVCWRGCEDGFAKEVLRAGEFAVTAIPQDGYFRDTRGVARCLVGNTAGALEDFKAFVDWAMQVGLPAEDVSKRLLWIADLQAGRHPRGLPGSRD